MSIKWWEGVDGRGTKEAGEVPGSLTRVLEETQSMLVFTDGKSLPCMCKCSRDCDGSGG